MSIFRQRSRYLSRTSRVGGRQRLLSSPTSSMFIGPKSVKVDTCPETGICKDWMKGKVIGVQISTAHANYAKKAFGDVAEVRTYDKQDNVNADLVAGRVDIVLADAVAMPFTFYFLASLFYLGITILSMLGQHRVEAWANRGVRRA